MKKRIRSSEYPMAVQNRHPLPGSDLMFTNAVPRETDYDLISAPSRQRMYGTKPDEQTFQVVKRGNCGDEQ